MSGSLTILFAFLTPLLGALLIGFFNKNPNIREFISLLSAIITFLLILTLVPGVLDGERPAYRLFELVPGLTIRFQLEPLGLLFSLISTLLWFVTIIFSIGYLRAQKKGNQTRFFQFFSLAMAAVIGGAFSGNLLTLYIFYEALTLATYPLVTHGGKEKDKIGGRIYITILLGTSLTMLLIAITWTWMLTGTLNFVDGGIFTDGNKLLEGLNPNLLGVIFALFIFGTGKAAIMPFHKWLPAAMVAPTPVSALLHAVAVVKLGVFTIIKVSIYIFGIGTLSNFEVGQFMQYVAATTIIIAAILAIKEDNIKLRLAYSTISQLSYIILAAIICNNLTLLSGGIHIAVHAFAKITLFFCAGIILMTLNTTKISDMNGIGRKIPITMTAWLISSFCIIGLPFTGGFWSKWYLAQGALDSGEPLMMAVILFGSVLAIFYLIPPVINAFFTPSLLDLNDENKLILNKNETATSSLIAVTFTSTMCIALFFLIPQLVSWLSSIEGIG